MHDDEVRHALDWMVGEDADIDDVDAHTLERFLWYELPAKWLTDLDQHRAVAAALGDALQLADRPLLAERCRSEETDAILAAFDRSWEEGMSRYRRAADASPVTPPDLVATADRPGLAWGSVMGLAEAGAHATAARQLGTAWESGRLVPGRRGWRAVQQAVVAEALARPAVDDPAGGTLLDAVIAERLATWASAPRLPAAAAARTRVARQLLHEPPIPEDADRALAPLRTLLAEADGDGIALTANHTLNVALVRDLAARFDWALPGFTARGERDETLVWQLHAMAKASGLCRRSKRRLVLTPLGRQALADPAVRWRVACQSLLAGDGFAPAAIQQALVLHLDGDGPVDRGVVEAATAQALAADGWAAGPDRDPVSARDVSYARAELWRRGAIHDFLPHTGADGSLTPVGRVAALTALRSAATGPRTNLHG